MKRFSEADDSDENIGELILKAFLSSNIDSITHLDLSSNRSWFWNERQGNLDLLAELITKEAGLQYLNLGYNYLSSNATLAILTSIADFGNNSKL